MNGEKMRFRMPNAPVKEMRRFVAMISILIITTGCAGNYELIKAASSSARHDVFQEIAPGAAPVPGYADLRINSTLKTHHPGMYSAKDIHGTTDYKIILNIDGQAAGLYAHLRGENIDCGAFNDPEAVEGIRYHFSKSIRIKAGTHRVIIAIPADGLVVEREITLPEGSCNSLTLEPVYRSAPAQRRPGFYGATSFTEGLKGLRLILNGKLL